MKNKLPEGWKEVELGEAVKLKGGFAFKSEEFVKQGIPIIRISNFNNNKVDLNDAVYYPNKESNRYIEFLLNENDILIAMSGATTGKIGIVTKESVPSLLNQRVGKFEIKSKELFHKYLLIYVKSKIFQEEVFRIASGCAQPNISAKQIESIKIPLPLLQIQQKIVSILEKAEQSKEMRKNADELTKDFLKAVFMEMFGNKKKFDKIKIDEVVVETENENPEREYPDNYFEYVDISSIDNKQGKIISSSKILGKEAPSRAKQKIKFNDIIISTVRPNLNSVALVPKELDQQICSTGFCILRADMKKVLPEYLYQISRSNHFIESMNKIAKGASYPAVSDKDILNYEIQLPPIEIQNKFASIVKEVESMKEQQKHSKDHLDKLFNALMQKAFKGELIC